MRRLMLSLGMAITCALALVSTGFAQTAPSGAAPAATAAPTNPNIIVQSKDPAGNADPLIPWFSSYANSVASDWKVSFGWNVPKPLTINLYTMGILMASDAGFYSVMPISIEQLIDMSNQPTIGVRDNRPTGPGGGNGGFIIGVNVNFTGVYSTIATSTVPTETQGSLVHGMALGMLQDVAGTGGPQWFREGLADLLANSRVPGMNEVGERATAWHMEDGSGILPTVPTVNQSWNDLTARPGPMKDATYKVADQVVFFLSQKYSVPQLVGILQRTSAGENFETALQSVTGYDLSQLDSAYRVTMPAY
jgi:hypothetical protein